MSTLHRQTLLVLPSVHACVDAINTLHSAFKAHHKRNATVELLYSNTFSTDPTRADEPDGHAVTFVGPPLIDATVAGGIKLTWTPAIAVPGTPPILGYRVHAVSQTVTGGEQIVAARCANDAVREKFMFMFNRYQAVIERHKTSDLSDSQPTKGNIAGGLTTIEEKALGNIQKIGKKCTVDGVIDKAEMPTHPGLWFMDSSSAAAEMVTLCAASGFAVHFFPTGQGNVIGNPILPVIKICANPRTVRTMSEHIDVDTTGLLQRDLRRLGR